MGAQVHPNASEMIFGFAVVVILLAAPRYWLKISICFALIIGVVMSPMLLNKSFALAFPLGVWLLFAWYLISIYENHRLKQPPRKQSNKAKFIEIQASQTESKTFKNRSTYLPFTLFSWRLFF